MLYLITGAIIALLGVFTGAYIQRRAGEKETVTIHGEETLTQKIIAKFTEDDLPAPISPYEEARKTRIEKVKI